VSALEGKRELLGGGGPLAGARAIRLPAGLSARVHTRTAIVAGLLTLLLLALLVFEVGTGDYAISPGRVVATLLGGGDASTQFVVETLRLPRALTGLLVGLALGASGAIFQSLTRNPLGSPDVVGLVQGASAGAVLEIVVIGGGVLAVAGASLVGGFATAACVYGLAYRGGGVQPYRLVLVGVGVSALLVALVQYLLTRATFQQAQVAQTWLTGSLNGRGWDQVRPLAAALVILAPAVVVLARSLRTLEIGDDAARALGVGAERARLGLVFAGVALAASATAAAGPFLFVALAAPQIAHRLTRAGGAAVATAALLGAAMVLAADLASQRIFTRVELPAGVLTGVAGGLYLLWLLTREWRRAAA
jgi:iron complex transport system permease protein